MIPEEKLLSQIASNNKGYFAIINNKPIAIYSINEVSFGRQTFYTYGGKVWDAETNELLYDVNKGLMF